MANTRADPKKRVRACSPERDGVAAEQAGAGDRDRGKLAVKLYCKCSLEC